MAPRIPLLSLLATLALGASGLGTVLLVPTEAAAQTFAQPLVELIASGEVLGDGATPVELHLLALGADGKPISGLTGKFAGAGDGAKLVEVQAGLYRATWTPPAVEKRKTLDLNLQAKSGNQSIERTFGITVQPAKAGKIVSTASPERLVLGQDPSATLTFKVEGPAAATADLVAVASAGTVSGLTAMGDGRFVAQYSPPAAAFPQLALITVADRRNPSATMGHVVLPLVGKTAFPVQGEPNATLIVSVGGQEYIGQSDASGRGTVNIVVPPGVENAKVTSVVGGARTERPLDLQVPASKRVQLFPLTAAVPAEPTRGIPVRILITRADGGPDLLAKPTLSASQGMISEARHEAGGVYMATWTPPASQVAATVDIKVNLTDGKGTSEDTLRVALVPTRPGGIRLSAEPPTLDSSTTSFQVFAKVTDPSGAGASGRTLSFAGAGAAQDGQVRDLGSGDYQANFRTSGQGGVELTAVASVPASGNPLHRILVVPLKDRLTSNGDYAGFVVLTLDQYGYPVGNVPLELSVTTGDGRVPSSMTTDGQGVAIGVFAAGRENGLATLRVEGGGHVGSAVLVQGPEGLSLPPLLPSASAADATLFAAWKRATVGLRMPRGGAGVVAAPVESVGQAGPVARLMASAEPATVAPGGTVTLKVTAVDAQGRGTKVDKIDLVPTVGTAGPVTAMGNGQFQATLTVPPTATGEVKVMVAAANGAVGALISVPVSGAAVAAWGGAAPTETTQPTEPTKPVEPVQEPKKEKTPREKGEHPWLRTSLGYVGGFYSYAQESTVAGGPLYDNTVQSGFGVTSPAAAYGFDARARVWLPMFEYVGFEGSYRGHGWSIVMPEGFDDPIFDGVSQMQVKALGRYFYDAGPTRISGGAGVGMQVGDFLYFTQERAETADQTDQILYSNLVTTSTTFLFEGGVETGVGFSAKGEFELGVTDFKGVFSDAFRLDLNQEITKNFFLNGNFGRFHRGTKMYYGENKDYVGNLGDQLWFFGLSAGFQMK